MDESFTLTLSGTSSVLETRFFPPIELSPHKQYVLGLVDLLTFNSIPNVDEGHNKPYIVGGPVITFPTGSYEIEDLERFAQKVWPTLSIKPNNNTLRSEIRCDREIDFRPPDSVAPLLGFIPRLLPANQTHESDQPVSILKINTLRVECNITGGSFINGRKVRTIHMKKLFEPKHKKRHNIFAYSGIIGLK